MKPNFLIQFLDEGVVFRHLAPDDSWIETGRLEHKERWDTVKVDVIRRRAVRLGRGYIAAILLISNDFVNYTYVTLPEDGETEVEDLIRRHLALTTGDNADRQSFDFRESDGLVRVAFVDRDALHKLGQFVAGFGFHPVAFACFHPDRHDFEGVSIMELTESAIARGISVRDVERDMTLPGAGAPVASPFDARLENDGAGTSASGAGRPRNAPAVALIAGALGLMTVIQTAGQATASGGAGVVEDIRPTQAVQHSAEPLLRTAQAVPSNPAGGAAGDRPPAFITSGWKSAIAVPRQRQAAAADAKDLADRGFDPGGLSYELLALVAATQPAEHDLFARAPATIIPFAAIDPVADETALSNESVAFADPRKHLSPFPTANGATPTQDRPAVPDTGGHTERAAENLAATPDPQGSWKPLPFGRPALRSGSRHELKSLAFSRPLLRKGAREAEADQPGDAETESVAIAAVVKAIEADIDSQAVESARETPTKTPKRRPEAVAAVTAFAEGRPAPVSSKPRRRPDTAAADDPAPGVTTAAAASQANALPQSTAGTATTSLLATTLPTGGEGLDLQVTNLIGVYGKPDFLRALVRLPNGQFVNLYAGGDFDGGQVVEITNRSLTYIKNGRKHELHMPN